MDRAEMGDTAGLDATGLAERLIRLVQETELRRFAIHPVSFWDIGEYGEQSGEKRYTKVLHWLIDPTQSHGLGTQVADALLNLDDQRGPRFTSEAQSKDELQLDLPEGRTGRLDVALEDRAAGILLGIEAKVGAATSEQQLTDYGHAMEQLDYAHRHLIYLTGSTVQPGVDGWVNCTWVDVADICDSLLREGKVDALARTAVEDFSEHLRRRFGHSEVQKDVRSLFFTDGTADGEPVFDRELRAIAIDLGIEPATDTQADSEVRSIVSDKMRAELDLDGPSVTAILTYVCHLRPAPFTQTHAKDPVVQQLVTALRDALASGEPDADEVSAVVDDRGLLAAVKRPARGRQSLRFRLKEPGVVQSDGDGTHLYLAGSGDGRFPTVLGHPDESGCLLRGTDVLRTWTALAEAELAGLPDPGPAQRGHAFAVAFHELLNGFTLEAPADVRCRRCRDLDRHNSLWQAEAASAELLPLVRDFAREAHAGQTMKQGYDYFDHHVRRVAARLSPLGPPAVMGGYLHDVLEDTPRTVDDLRGLGVPDEVITAVESVTNRADEPYEELLDRARDNDLGRLIKLADNAQNTADLLTVDDVALRERLTKKYADARRRLDN